MTKKYDWPFWQKEKKNKIKELWQGIKINRDDFIGIIQAVLVILVTSAVTYIILFFAGYTV